MDGPQFYLLKSGEDYIVVEAVLSVKEGALPASVRNAIAHEFRSVAHINGVKLPDPKDSRAIFKLFQAYRQACGTPID